MQKTDEILKLVESLRQKMHIIAVSKGISDPEVLEVSRKLDEALNKYQSLLSKSKS